MIQRLRDFKKLLPGIVEEIPIHAIKDEHARKMARNIHLENRATTTIAVMCSDSRNKALRELISRVPGIRVYSNAGGLIYDQFYLSTIVFDHGTQCGARDYAKKVKYATGKKLSFPSFAEVHPEQMKNAEKQLNKVSEKYRGGIIYFQQETGEISFHTTSKQGVKYDQSFECERIVHELNSLRYRYSPEEFAQMANGQNPNVILLTNGFVNYNADIFRIDMQNNALHDIIFDSLNYAASHALTNNGSFRDTDSIIICLDKVNHPFPKGFSSFFKRILPILQSFKERGGETILMSLGQKESAKRIYRIT